MTAMLKELAENIHSPAMQDVVKITKRASNSDLGVLITGAFGTGKEWLARRMHMLSMRAGKPFITVDFSTIPHDMIEQELLGTETGGELEQGILEDVNGGTVLFGGFSTIPLSTQAKIARVIEHQKFHRIGGKKEIWFNGRLIIAEKNNPSESAAQNQIYSRLAPVQIEMPPLRDRQEDLLPLIHQFIGSANERNGTSVTGINSQALDLCMKYAWPGNVRELRNTAEYAVIMCQKHLIQPAHLPLQVRGGMVIEPEEIVPRRTVNVMELEKTVIENAMRQTGTRKEAARLLGISIKTLYNKLHRYSLDHLLNDRELQTEPPKPEQPESEKIDQKENTEEKTSRDN